MLLLAAAAPGRGASAQSVLLPHFECVALPGTFTLADDLVFAPDGTLFVAQKAGQVRVIAASGQAQSTPFIDLTAEVNNDHDRGLLGFALAPGFVPNNGPNSWVYLLYTVSPVAGQDFGFDQNQQYSFSRLVRYKARTTGGNIVANAATRQVLIGKQLADGSVPDAIASLHHSHACGALLFGADGSLLVATGDGAHYDFNDTGGFDDPGFDDFVHPVTGLRGPTPAVQDSGAFRSQDLRSLAGKILRVDPATGLGYASNPFHDGDPASNASRVWALGLRNPFRMAAIPGTGLADPAAGQPGMLLIGDVGLNSLEELDLCRGGENFQWPCFEAVSSLAGYQGFSSAQDSFPDCHAGGPGLSSPPVLSWSHHVTNQVVPAGVYVDGAGHPLPGFQGSCVVAGSVYTGGSFPPEYNGRLFVADYENGWIKTVQLDAAQHVVAVRDFASGMGAVVDIACSPVTGDLYCADVVTGKLSRIHYGSNLTPVAAVQADVAGGPAPLTVHFTSTGTHDPEGDPLGFAWDFGDGTHAGTPAPEHTFTAEGNYAVTLSVSDPGGLVGHSEALPIVVAAQPFSAQILSPAQGELFDVPAALQLDGDATHPGPPPLSWHWTVDQHHETHVHPAVFSSSEQHAVFPIGSAGEEGEPVYYRVELVVTDGAGASTSAHVFVFPRSAIRDVTGTALPITRMSELSPPWALGHGTPDPEVMRDGRLPPVGSSDASLQFASDHGGAQGDDDWIGYALPAAPGDAVRFVALTFQEGLHFPEGGWFQEFAVEVRHDGAWSPAGNLRVTPAYPFALAGQPSFDGTSCEVRELRFDPVGGDAIRLRGKPGGSGGFITCAELRARVFDPEPPPGPHHDITAGGSVVAKVFALVPPGPLGQGSKDPSTVSNGTWPPAGSFSALAQFDTFHNGDQGNQDWIGYDFGGTRTFSRIVFQEGLHFPDGGGFLGLGAEVQAASGGPWMPLAALQVSPAYAGLNATSYETFTLDFTPTTGRAIRIVGPPAGSRKYISVGELAVFTPELGSGCGWSAYGQGLGGANSLQLDSQTPPGLGLPIEIDVSGAAPGSGFLLLALHGGSLPWRGGTLLVGLDAPLLIPIAYGSGGSAVLAGVLPGDAALAGIGIWMQALAFGQPAPFAVRLSNGLKLALCAW